MKNQDINNRNIKDQNAKDRNAKDQDVNNQNAKDQDVNNQNAKDQDVNNQNANNQDVNNQNANNQNIKNSNIPVRAKFRCDLKEAFPESRLIAGQPDEKFNNYKIELTPVYEGSEENRKFFNATPGGKIQMTVVNESAASQFEVGKEYYLDFVLAS